MTSWAHHVFLEGATSSEFDIDSLETMTFVRCENRLLETHAHPFHRLQTESVKVQYCKYELIVPNQQYNLNHRWLKHMKPLHFRSPLVLKVLCERSYANFSYCLMN